MYSNYYNNLEYNAPAPPPYWHQPGFAAMSRDVNGQPVVTLHPMTFEQQMLYRNQMIVQQRQYIEKRLKENFPVIFVFIYAALLILIGLAEFVLQIILIVNQTHLYYVGNGIWGGIICVYIAVMSILLAITRAYKYYIVSLISNMIGAFLLFLSLVMLNVIALSQYNRCVLFQCNDNGTDLKSINLAMLILGVVAFALCLSFIIVISCTLSYFCANKQHTAQNYTVQPTPVEPYIQNQPQTLYYYQSYDSKETI